MDLRGTTHAGGASKNLASRQQLMLLPGQYAIHFQTNESHSYAAWNDYPPHDPYFWGITLWPMGEGNNQAVSVERQRRLKPILENQAGGQQSKKGCRSDFEQADWGPGFLLG